MLTITNQIDAASTAGTFVAAGEHYLTINASAA